MKPVRRPKPVRLTLERLEDRSVPAVWGNPWPDAQQLTLSFAPDGTAVQTAQSTLFQELNERMPTSVWQREVLRAFQTWAVQGNINVGIVNDNGKPFGDLGPVQGSASYGDVRLGSVALSENELAVATPFDLFSGWSGEVLLNSSHSFSQGQAAGSYDLFTVLLQEAGHVFGLPNSTDSASVMYTEYQGVRGGLHASDVAALQSLYGARLPDRFEGTAGNNTFANAKPISFVYDADQLAGSDGSQGAQPFVARGDLTTLSDVDYYRFIVPTGVKDFTVRLRTSGVSLTTTRVEVYDAAFKRLKSASAASPGGDLSLFITGAKANATYYVRVDGATEDLFGIGSYRLAVGKEANEALFPPTVFALVNNDAHTNDTLATAAALARAAVQTEKSWDYTYRASVSGDGDVDFYRLTSPASGGVLLVNVWATDVNKLKPTVALYDGLGQLVAADLLSDDAGSYTLQVSDVAANSAYYVRIAAADPLSSYKEGNYSLAVDFRSAAVQKENFASGAATTDAPQVALRLQTTKTHLFRFMLSANCADTSVETGVRLVVYDASDRVVHTIFARSAQTVSVDLFLAAGSYTFRFIGGAKNRALFAAPITFNLSGVLRSDPIGPGIDDPTSTPPGSGPSYSWTPASLKLSWLSASDPYSDPWNGL